MNTIQSWERGGRKRPQPATRQLLLDALGLEDVDRDALFKAAAGLLPDQDPLLVLPSPPTSFIGRAALAERVASDVNAAGTAW